MGNQTTLVTLYGFDSLKFTVAAFFLMEPLLNKKSTYEKFVYRYSNESETARKYLSAAFYAINDVFLH